MKVRSTLGNICGPLLGLTTVSKRFNTFNTLKYNHMSDYIHTGIQNIRGHKVREIVMKEEPT